MLRISRSNPALSALVRTAARQISLRFLITGKLLHYPAAPQQASKQQQTVIPLLRELLWLILRTL